jgi:6-phosphogluconolactonase (cycloisomerase 2 family)
MVKRRLWLRGIALAPALLLLALAGTASAASTVYWGNTTGPISFARLDGSGGGELNTTGVAVNNPRGVALDPAAGRLYWTNIGGPPGISYTGLDGSGGAVQILGNSTNAQAASGVAVDHAAGRIYWAEDSANQIFTADLDGGGRTPIDTTGAEVNDPWGVALDPTAGRIYWANINGNSIGYANLNGSGGGDLNTSGATVNQPDGPAIDAATGRLYWSNNGAAAISYANLDGSGGGDLSTGSATVSTPRGVAINSDAGLIYWANEGANVISYAHLDGSGGGDLATPGAPLSGPNFPALLEAPSGAGAPTVSGDPTSGSRLDCSSGAWAPDAVASNLYRAPQSFAYQWGLNGAPIAGATGSFLVAAEPGSYACQVTAANHAGSSAQTSAPLQVKPSNEFTIGKVKRTKLAVTLTSPGAVRAIAIVPKRKKKRRGGPGPAIKPSTASGGPGRIWVPLRLTHSAKATLKRAHRLTFSARVTFTPTGGDPKTKTATLKLKGRKRRK